MRSRARHCGLSRASQRAQQTVLVAEPQPIGRGILHVRWQNPLLGLFLKAETPWDKARLLNQEIPKKNFLKY